MPSRNNRTVKTGALRLEIDEFLVDRQARNLAPKTILWYKAGVLRLHAYMTEQGVTETAAITPALLRRFILHLSETHNPGGVFGIFGAVKTFLRWYAAEYAPKGWENPLDRVESPKRITPPQRSLPMSDFEAMLKTCGRGATLADARDRAILLTLLDTGVRHAEFAALQLEDVDLPTGAIVVKLGKGRKTRVTFVGNKTRKALFAYLRFRGKEPGALWVTLAGSPLSKGGIREIIRRRAEKAGVKEPGMHEFRRAFALNYLRNGGDVETLRRLLGHSDFKVLARYLSLEDEDLRQAHGQHGPVDNMLKK